jgi:hypothetical protein
VASRLPRLTSEVCLLRETGCVECVPLLLSVVEMLKGVIYIQDVGKMSHNNNENRYKTSKQNENVKGRIF